MVIGDTYDHLGADILTSMRVEVITAEGMKIDRMFFERFEDMVRDIIDSKDFTVLATRL